MFERDSLGGLWLNAGCVPAKVYLNKQGGSALDLQGALVQKNAIITKLNSIMARQMRSRKVRIEIGEAVLKSPNEVLCRDKVFTASKIILCGGTKPDFPLVNGLSHPAVLTVDKVFKLYDLPQRLLVLGGGSEACEIAAAFAGFGSDVMLIETRQKLLVGWDTEIAEAVEKSLIEIGVKVHTGVAVRDITDRSGSPYVITERGGVLCDNVVIATERKPDLTSLGALINEIDLEDGMIVVNEYMETSIPGVFAAGDVTGLGFQTYAACRMAETAASNVMRIKQALDLWAVPTAIYTTPEVASVGLSEDDAREKYGDNLLIGYSSFSDNVKAMIQGNTDGFVKVLAGRKHGEIYGVHMVGANASELIERAAALMRMEVTLNEVINDIMHAHPVYAEAFTEACANALGSER